LGALAIIVGGNVLIIVLGRAHPLAGIAAGTGRAMVALGVFGLVERCAVYPVLIAFICAGRSIWKSNPTGDA
jgi:hypothetical protein